MSFGDLISVRIARGSDDVVTLHYTTEGLDGGCHPHHSTWIKVHSWHCPSCGKTPLITSVDVYEDNAGDQYICLHCGFGFMFTGGEYLGIPKAARDDLVAYYDVTAESEPEPKDDPWRLLRPDGSVRVPF
jgi:predicted RNA-binding Zn-ribbon protein involved in translation (DUF1610 family)